MKKYFKRIDSAYTKCRKTNKDLILILELEDEVSKLKERELLPSIGEPVLKECLPNLYRFESHYEWNSKDKKIVEKRLMEATFFYYMSKGYIEERRIDKNVLIQRFLQENKQDSFVVEVFRKRFFSVFKKLTKYVGHFNNAIDKLIYDAFDRVVDYNETAFFWNLFGDRVIYATVLESVLFVYGLYLEIIEIYDPKKSEVALF